MSTFVDPFGGGLVDPIEQSYSFTSMTGDIGLALPGSGDPNAVLAARMMELSASGAGFRVFLPDATTVSTGFSILFSNVGSFTITIVRADGSSVATLAAGAVRFVFNRNNTTVGGSWQSILFGASAGSFDAGSLAGLGLRAVGAQLQTAAPVLTLSTSYTVTSGTRGQALVWLGGTGTISLPAVASQSPDFYFEVANQGTGQLVIDPAGAELIDSLGTISLGLGESCFVHCGLSAWYTVGRGRNALFNFTLLTKSITGGSTTLTGLEASNVVQKYTGALTSNAIVVLPSVVQVYYVTNATTGAFTLTFKTAVGGGAVVAIPQGQAAILFCDGTNVSNNSTTIAGVTNLLLAPGSAAAPSLAFSADTTSGMFQPASGEVGISAGGVEVVDVDATGVSVEGTFIASGAATAASLTTDFLTVFTSATINSLALTGSATTPNVANGDNSTKVANTHYVDTTAFNTALPAQLPRKVLWTDGVTAGFNYAYGPLTFISTITNFIVYSEDLSQSSVWLASSCSLTDFPSGGPGGGRAQLVLDNSAVAIGDVIQSVAVTPGTEVYSVSAYFKYFNATDCSFRLLMFGGTPTSTSTTMNLSAGSFTGSPIVENVGGGYYRVTLQLANNGTNNSIVWQIVPRPVAAVDTGGLYVAFAQLSLGTAAFIASLGYLPTGAAAAKGMSFSASSNVKYHFDSSGLVNAGYDIILPPSPAHGDWIEMTDAAGNWGTFPPTVRRNGKNLQHLPQDMAMGVNNAAIRLVYDQNVDWILS